MAWSVWNKQARRRFSPRFRVIKHVLFVLSGAGLVLLMEPAAQRVDCFAITAFLLSRSF